MIYVNSNDPKVHIKAYILKHNFKTVSIKFQAPLVFEYTNIPSKMGVACHAHFWVDLRHERVYTRMYLEYKF